MDLQEFSQLLNRAAPELRRGLASELIRTAMRAEKEAKLRVTAGGFTGLNVRTGRLRSSIAGSVTMQPNSIEIKVQAGGQSPNPRQLIRTAQTSNPGEVRYARIHEEGGTIRPVRAKFLTIPIHHSLRTPAGRRRFTSARDVPDLTYAESAGGQRMLVHKTTGEVYYLLRRSIEIMARPYLAPGMRTAVVAMNEDIFRAIRRLFRVRFTE
tara:strand:- start:448 stop:1077 length:630 start_codon:yes stop_codon:yes gene_type:complete